ncbi:MAG: hypothetical protein EOO40_00325 [Deltaproteobacteria bacterium]|nr:MAG: hypothetical protein EOO40_00325 [Deltaproteobacteria bacterium]
MAGRLAKPKVKVMDKAERQRRIEAVLRKARNCYVKIGLKDAGDVYPTQGENAQPVTVGQVGAWMEFGTHSKAGIEMVPARSFLRTPVDNGMKTINRVRVQQIDRIIQGETGIAQGLEAIGAKVQLLVQNAMTRGIRPRLAKSTLKKKRALGQPDTPLIATKFSFDHIGFEVVLNR